MHVRDTFACMPKREKPSRVREPVQVYLAQDDNELLVRVAAAAGLSKAEVLRRGVRSFAREHAGASPMLKFLKELASNGPPAGIARAHDDVLAESYRSRPKRRT